MGKNARRCSVSAPQYFLQCSFEPLSPVLAMRATSRSATPSLSSPNLTLPTLPKLASAVLAPCSALAPGEFCPAEVSRCLGGLVYFS